MSLIDAAFAGSGVLDDGGSEASKDSKNTAPKEGEDNKQDDKGDPEGRSTSGVAKQSSDKEPKDDDQEEDSEEGEGKKKQPPKGEKPKESTQGYAGTKHKVKINDKEEEVSYEDLVKSFQKQKASDEKFRQASEKEKLFHSFISAARNGDLGWLAKVAPQDKLLQFAEKKLLEKIEYDEMTPEQRKSFENEQRLKKYEDSEKAQKEQEQARQFQEAQKTAFEDVQRDVFGALKELGIESGKANPRLVLRIVEQMRASFDPNEKDPKKARLPAGIAAKRAMKGMEVDVKEFLSTQSSDHIISLLPESVLDAVRKKFLGQVTEPQRVERKNPEQREERRTRRKSRFSPTPMSEFFANL